VTIQRLCRGLAGAEGGGAEAADVVSGAYEQPLKCSPRASTCNASCSKAAPQIAIGIGQPRSEGLQSPKDLKGLKVRFSPWLSTHMILNHFISTAAPQAFPYLRHRSGLGERHHGV